MKIIVTGATSGIGNAISKLLLEKGSIVLGIGRDKSKIIDLLEKYPNQFVFAEINLNECFSIDSYLDDFVLKYGKFNGFVNCAGKEETLPITMYTQKKLAEIFNVNFNGPFEILRLLAKKKYSENHSSFVFISSVMGELGQPGKTAYCSSKAALLGLVKASALELASRNIRVNAISPGVVDTPMTQHLFTQISEENMASIINMHPLGIGQISDITPLLMFLLSPESRWITGQNIIIDGGYSIQ